MGNLEKISFFASPIEDEQAVAVYLSQFCRSCPDIAAVGRVKAASNERAVVRVKDMTSYIEKWVGVSRMLQTILKALQRERRLVAPLLGSQPHSTQSTMVSDR